MVDNIDKTQIGRYGTISLLKRQGPQTIVTSFGIDTEELTFGRNHDCSIRLYYADVDSVHCKIVFEDRKAFLIVLGKNGLLVDGCLVYPNPNVHGPQTTIPLTNNSEIEIHQKLFRFTYPPKELRAMLFASPIRQNRAPRLSMIRSAEVFSPKLSKGFEEKLQLLQSPLKSTFLRSPLDDSNHISNSNQDRDSSKPIYHRSSRHNKEKCEEIILVESDNPRVVEEEKDLVILEDVEVPPSTPPEWPNPHHLHLSNVNPLQTPHRCQNLRDGLHRAALIRSTQRAVLRAEKEEDELEEMEVLSAVASDEDNVEFGDEHESNTSMDVWNEKSISRQTLDLIPHNAVRTPLAQDLPIAVESGTHDQLSPSKLNENLQWKQDNIEGEKNEGIQNIPSEDLAHSPTCYESVDKFKYLGGFRTPQPRSRQQLQKQLTSSLFGFKTLSTRVSGVLDDSPNNSSEGANYSIASGEPRRMLVEMPWRVEDLVVPAKSEKRRAVDPNDITPLMPSTKSDSRFSTALSIMSGSTRREVDERERKAIRERRRSALREVDSFFAGGIPGMGSTPTKNTTLPYRQGQGLHDTPKGRPMSSLEEDVVALSWKVPDMSKVKREEEKELDAQMLLERMKVTVEEMRRRRSMAFASPSSLGQSPSPAPVAETRNPGAQMQVENSREQHPMDQTEEHGEQHPFSLLRSKIESLQDENEDQSKEKSFSQLMRSESPEDLEQPSEDIRHILEQDITIPSGNLISAPHPVRDNTWNNQYTVGRSTRSRTASVEPDKCSSAHERDTAREVAHAEQLSLVANDRPVENTRKVPGRDMPAPSATQLRGRKPEQATIMKSQMTSDNSKEQEVSNKEVNTSEDEAKRESTPTPAPRIMRASRRCVSVASMTNSKQVQNKVEDLQEVSSNTSNRRMKVAMNPNSGAKRKPRKERKEDLETSEVEEIKKTRTRSNTVNGGALRTATSSKTPATRTGIRKTPVTAPSAVTVNCEDEKPNARKENSWNSKVTPADGTKVRISRNKAKAEETTTQRVTRARTRART